jgi:hypothetical protein
MSPITGRLDLTAWRNDDYYEYPLRVRGIDLTGIVLVMEVRRTGDTSGPALIALGNVTDGQNGATFETKGIHVRSVSVVDGIATSDLRIRMDRATLRAMPYYGELGEAADFEYAFLIGGRTRLIGKFILPAHAYGSDNADEDRPESTGLGWRSNVPDAGATLNISQDGGATVVIDGADLVSMTSDEAKAAAAAAADALAQTQAISTTSYRAVPGYPEREAIPLDQRGNGLRVQTMVDNRIVEWRTAMFAPGGWTSLLNEEELTRRQLQHGTQGQDTIDGLPATLAAQASAIADLQGRLSFASLRVDSFTVTPSQVEMGSTVSSLAMAWSYTGGPPNGQSIERSDGQRITGISPSERTTTVEKLPAPVGVLIIGDSQPWEWAPEYAAALNLPLALAARPAHTIFKQAIMVGADPLTVSIAGGTLPAAGTKATVTLVNGGPTTAANPAAILHSAVTGVDAIQVDLVVAGGTRRCTLSHDITNALDTYKIEQAAGGAAVAVADGAVAVPTFKAMAATTHRVVIMAGHNDMLDHDPAGGFAGIRARTDSIMALCADNLNPVQLNDFWPAANTQEIAQIPFIQAHSQWLRDKYPGAITLDGAGRTLWERLRGPDKTIPANLRKPDDTLHLDAPGRTIWTGHNQEDDAARRRGAAPLTSSASFTIRGRGAVPGLPAVESAMTATVTFLPRRFWGVSASDALTKAQVIALAGSELSSGRAKAVTVNPAAQFVYLAYLAALGDPTAFKIGGFNEQYVKTTVSVTTAAGLTADYTVLRSLNKLTGAAPVEVQ